MSSWQNWKVITYKLLNTSTFFFSKKCLETPKVIYKKYHAFQNLHKNLYRRNKSIACFFPYQSKLFQNMLKLNTLLIFIFSNTCILNYCVQKVRLAAMNFNAEILAYYLGECSAQKRLHSYILWNKNYLYYFSIIYIQMILGINMRIIFG